MGVLADDPDAQRHQAKQLVQNTSGVHGGLYPSHKKFLGDDRRVKIAC